MSDCNLTAEQLLRDTPKDVQAYHWQRTGGNAMRYTHGDYVIDAVSYGDVDYVTHISKYQIPAHRYAVVKKIYDKAAQEIYEHASKAYRNEQAK